MCSVTEATDCHKALLRRSDHQVAVGALDMWDKPQVIRRSLAVHNKQLNESAFNNQVLIVCLDHVCKYIISWTDGNF